ncbi:MAG TPA: hypothetical protein QGF83_07105 [Sulfitobacter pontiacus]|uniref:hypothetical protein n=1 Tax=Sulfitobacter pontiacus TaxID=60137 RepID=UPI002AC20430|nr:hypothetical protein [Sulfitobacter pontiacus]
MPQAIDWEAQIEEIRRKATAAARHSERTVNGVAQTLSQVGTQAQLLVKIDKEQQGITNRLGSLERKLIEELDHAKVQPMKGANTHPAVLLRWLSGVVLGALLSGAFFWS